MRFSSVDGGGFEALDSNTIGEEFVGEVRIGGTSKADDAAIVVPRVPRSKDDIRMAWIWSARNKLNERENIECGLVEKLLHGEKR